MTDYLTLFGTAINRRPEQLLGIVRRSVKSKLLPRLPVDMNRRYEQQVPDELAVNVDAIRTNTRQLRRSTADRRVDYRMQAQQTASGTLSFLNDTVEFDGGESISLAAERLRGQPLHWKLKCWGFKHLADFWLGYSADDLPAEHRELHHEWLAEWLDCHPIAATPEYLRREWMPHSVCLRICNWSRYDALFGEVLSPEFRRDIQRFVYKNAAFLSDNVEYGVGGNHLIENAIALVIAGVYLDEQQWRRQGRQIFERAAETQFFEDGGHFERSPMYHTIVCQRYLSAVSILSAVGASSKPTTQCAADTVGFLQRLRPPDGSIPLLNDSVLGEALPLEDCLAYAREVGIGDGGVGSSGPSSNAGFGGGMADTGYYWLGEGDDKLLVTAHEVAVPHMPAHAHVHPGQVCLWVDGKRVLTDTGVYEYAAGQRRQRARSIRSHNTVQVADLEPVRMASSFWLWGEFDPDIRLDPPAERVEFSYSASGVGRSTYRHEREIEHEAGHWTISDHVDTDVSPVVSRFHVHPDFGVEIVNGDVVVRNEQDETALTGVPFGHDTVSIESAPYHPEYGIELERSVIELRTSDRGAFGMRFGGPVQEKDTGQG